MVGVDRGITLHITDMLFSLWCLMTGEFVPITMAYCAASDVWWQRCWFQLQWHIAQLLMCYDRGVGSNYNGILFSLWCVTGVFVQIAMAYCSASDVWWQGCLFKLQWHIVQFLMCDDGGVCFNCNGMLFSFWCLITECLFQLQWHIVHFLMCDDRGFCSNCNGIFFSFWCMMREAVISIVTRYLVSDV